MLAVNQYLAICSPLFAQTRITHGRAGLCVIAAWITSATAAALPALMMLVIHYSDGRRVCTDYTNGIANKSLEVRIRLTSTTRSRVYPLLPYGYSYKASGARPG